jgi:branched-chain amino acid transport system substrate-binding protein
MMKRLAFRIVAALATVVVASATAAAGGDETPVSFAAVFNTTGSQAELDLPSAAGAKLAADEINKAGGVDGAPVVLIGVDGDTVPADLAARTRAALTAHPDVVALFGLSDTDMVLASADVAADDERLFVTSGASSPKLPEQVPVWLYLACFGDNVQAAAAAEWVYRERGARKAAVIFDSTMTYTSLLHGYFEERFKALGGEVLSVESYAGGEADVVYLAGGVAGDILAAIARIRAAGFQGPIVGGDSYDAADVWQKHPEVEGVFFTTHVYLGADNPNPKVQAFRELWAAAHPGVEPTAFAALGYDTVNLLAAAVRAAKSSDPDAVRQALATISGFVGVTGPIGYPAGSHIPLKPAAIMAVAGGKVTHVMDLTPSDVPQP